MVLMSIQRMLDAVELLYIIYVEIYLEILIKRIKIFH